MARVVERFGDLVCRHRHRGRCASPDQCRRRAITVGTKSLVQKPIGPLARGLALVRHVTTHLRDRGGGAARPPGSRFGSRTSRGPFDLQLIFAHRLGVTEVALHR